MTESEINLQWSTNDLTTFKTHIEPSEFYNLFIDHYNRSDQKIKAVAEIGANRDEFSAQIKNNMNVINRVCQDLREIPKTPVLSSESSKSSDYHYKIYANLAIKKVLSELDEIIKMEHHINNSNKTLEKLERFIRKSFNRGGIEHYPAIECMFTAKFVCTHGDIIGEYRENRESLNKLISQVFMFNYPPDLPKWEDLSDEYKQGLHGATLQKHKQKDVQQQIHYPEILKATLKVIEDKPLSDFLTSRGNANSALYKGIYSHYKGVALGTLRDWLNEDLKNGKFVKGLNSLRREIKKTNS